MRNAITKLLCAAAVAFVATACQTTGGQGGAFCDVEKPTRSSRATIAAMSHDELAAAVSHNDFGRRACGWRP